MICQPRGHRRFRSRGLWADGMTKALKGRRRLFHVDGLTCSPFPRSCSFFFCSSPWTAKGWRIRFCAPRRLTARFARSPSSRSLIRPDPGRSVPIPPSLSSSPLFAGFMASHVEFPGEIFAVGRHNGSRQRDHQRPRLVVVRHRSLLLLGLASAFPQSAEQRLVRADSGSGDAIDGRRGRQKRWWRVFAAHERTHRIEVTSDALLWEGNTRIRVGIRFVWREKSVSRRSRTMVATLRPMAQLMRE